MLIKRVFWLMPPEQFELQKIHFPLLGSVFEDLPPRKKIFSNWSTKSADFVQYADFSIKSQPFKKIRHFENFQNLSS